MVQIIPQAGAVNRPRDAMEKFAQSFSGALADREAKQEQARQLFQQEKQMQQENQQIKQLTGMDLSGIRDPKQRQEAFKQAFEARQEQEYLNQIMGGSQERSPMDGQEPIGDSMERQQGQRNGGGLSDLPEEKLQALLGTKRFKEPAKAELERRKQEKQQKEVYQIYKDAGFSDEEAAERAATSSPATARTIFREKTEKPLFEAEGEKLEAKRVAELATEVEKNYTTARNEDIRLDRMEALSNKGEVSTPAMMKALDTIGLPIGILSNPDTEEYRKLETDFIRDARDIFPGGRITNYEIQSYLKTIPTLMNSKEGREAIIRNRKLLNEAKKVRYEEYKNILKETGGKKPANMGILLEERTADKIIDIEDRFRDGIDSVLDKHSQKIRMVGQDGKSYDIPAHMIPQAQQQGLMFR